MAYITIPELPLGSALSGLEQFESVQSSTSVKLTSAQLKAYVTKDADFTTTDAVNNAASVVTTFTHQTTGVPANGIGASIALASETTPGNDLAGVQLSGIATNVAVGVEDFDFVVSLINNGAAISEVLRLTSNGLLKIVANDAANNNVSNVLQLTHTTSGVPANGIGAGMVFEVETASGNNEIGAAIDAIATDVSAGVEDFNFVFSLMNNGLPLAEVLRITSAGRLGVGISNPSAQLEVALSDANNAAPVTVARFSHATTGVPSVGIGTAIDFLTETANGNFELGGAIYTTSTDVTSNAEDFDLSFAVMQNGIAGVEIMRLTSDERVGINTSAPQATIHAVASDAATNTVTPVARVTHITSATPANGIGTSVEFETETSSGNFEIGGVISSVATDVSSGVEDFDFVFSTMQNGAAASESLRVGSVIKPTVPFHNSGFGIAPALDSQILVQSDSLTIAPIKLNPVGAQRLTTQQTGAFEYDAECLYFTPSLNQRGIIPTEMIYINNGGTRLGPNATNAAQACTFVGGNPVITAAAVPGNVVGKTGHIAIFSAVAAPTGVTLARPYFVNFVTPTTFTISETPDSPPIVPGSAGTTVTVIFHFTIVGSGVQSAYLSLSANTRYQYDLLWTVSHTSAGATAIAFAAINTNGSIGAHSYSVEAFGSAAAFVGKLTSTTPTTNSFVSNYLTSNFSVQALVTGATGAVANTTNLVRIRGYIDVLTAIDYFAFTYGMNVAPAVSTLFEGAYLKIAPIGLPSTDTNIGSWRTS